MGQSEINLIKDHPVVRPPGPIAVWKFDGDLINKVTNFSLSNNMASVTFVSDRHGIPNSAVVFNSGTMLCRYRIAR